MDRSFRLVDCNVSLEEQRNRKRSKSIDWALCVLCQDGEATEGLRVPTENKRAKKDEGYALLGRNLPEFKRLGKWPANVDLEQLQGNGDIETHLSSNGAVWHHSCYLKCSNSKLNRLRISVGDENIPPSPSPIPTRRVSSPCPRTGTDPVCFDCGEKATKTKKLHLCTAPEKLKERAAQKSDTRVLVQLNGKVTDRLHYHKTCLSNYLYYKKELPTSPVSLIKDDSLGSVVDFINDSANEDTSAVFKMSEIKKLYVSDLEEQGILSEINSSVLKEKILNECPYLESSGKPGQSSLLRFKSDVDAAVRAGCAQTNNSCLSQCLNQIRQDIFNHPRSDWTDMSQDTVDNCIPASLRNLVSILLDGQEATDENKYDPVLCTLSQLIFFHARKTSRGQGSTRRHNASKETPAPVYVACKLYRRTRSKELVDTAFEMGLSISYDRLQTILTERGNKAASQYQQDGVVCPLNLELGCFTTGQIDNIDSDTSSATAMDSFHGTAISLMQHGPSGEKRAMNVDATKQRKIAELPVAYTVVPPCPLDPKSAQCPTTDSSHPALPEKWKPSVLQSEWLEKCCESTTANTWPGHHAQECPPCQHRSRFAILPLFREKSSTLAMMAHGMDVVMKATKLLNPQQVPVIVGDQPLYALCKLMQWLRPEELGENKVFVMMGAMHIEAAALRSLGDWLEGSGWSTAVAEAGITTQGRSDAVLNVNHLDRARYIHQVGAAVLYTLKRKAYEQHACDDPVSFEEWCEQGRKRPQFRYWDIALHLQLACFQIVLSLRNPNIKMFNTALVHIAPFFFALDHQNYARWLPVHIKDIHNLERLHPSLWQHFMEGQFVAQKTGRDFSAIPLDQAHEQLNAVLKGDGGMVGLTESPEALLKFILTTPESADIVQRFEENILHRSTQGGGKHHLDNERSKAAFIKHKRDLQDFFENAGNPFAEESDDLYNIDTRKCCDKEVVNTVMKIEDLGKAQFEEYCLDRLEKGSTSIHAAIKKNNLPTFARALKAKPTADKAKHQIKALQENLDLMNRMWVASSSQRPVDPEEFYSREISEFPPALALSNGDMRSTTKSDLLNDCLAPLLTTRPDKEPPVDAKVYDGAVLMYLLKPSATCARFSNFREDIFYSYLKRESQRVSRMDIVWDSYSKSSLKRMTREVRGAGVRTRVAYDTKLPRKWLDFLRDQENKKELFEFLADGLPATGDVAWYSTKGENVVTNCGRVDMSGLAPCNHEEADTRIFVHVADAVRDGRAKVMVHSCDTDVVVLAVSAFAQFDDSLQELWIRHTASKAHRFIPVHELANTLGPEKCVALPCFHAFTGCDNVESMYLIGKKSAWKTISLMPEVWDALKGLKDGEIDGTRKVLEKFVIALYSPGKSYKSINDCRRKMLPARKKHECIPPTADALEQRTRRASLMAQVWGQLLQPMQVLPSPADWGWKLHENGWIQRWTTLPPNSVQNVAIVGCGCRVACIGNCKCRKEGVECVVGLCKCICVATN